MRISVIGAGAMGGAFVDGLLFRGGSDIPGVGCASDIVVANPTASKLTRFKEKGAIVTTSNTEAVMGADVVVLAVKPWLVETVMEEIAPVVAGRKVTLVSFAAGVSLPGVITVIPNIAIAQRQSMTFIGSADLCRDSVIQASLMTLAAPSVAAADVPEEDVRIVKTLFDQLGQTRLVGEKQLRAGTILASCGIAYAMRYIRAAAEGGVEIGFRADEARDIVLQTLRGAIDVLQATGLHPEKAIDLVTTPGGITIRGLNAMEQAGFTNAVIQGLKAPLSPLRLPPLGEKTPPHPHPEWSSPPRSLPPKERGLSPSPNGGSRRGLLGGIAGLLVVKVGSNVLTRPDGKLDVTRMSAIVDQIAWLRQQGHEVILVTSGAVACGRSRLHTAQQLDSVEQRQLFSAVGQVKLVGLYYDLFREHQIPVGQVLTMKENFEPGEQYENQQACMRVMLENGVLPIVNENDTVCVTELMFTDNDELSGLIARMMKADALILLTNVDGIYTASPDQPGAQIISTVKPDDDLTAHISNDHSSMGRGGMASKYHTARSVAAEGIRVIIANGTRSNILPQLLQHPEDVPHTIFLP